MVTKWLYPEVAKHYETACTRVEQGIRLSADTAWKTHPELLERLSHGPIREKPTASEFISILAAYFFTDPRAA